MKNRLTLIYHQIGLWISSIKIIQSLCEIVFGDLIECCSYIDFFRWRLIENPRWIFGETQKCLNLHQQRNCDAQTDDALKNLLWHLQFARWQKSEMCQFGRTRFIRKFSVFFFLLSFCLNRYQVQLVTNENKVPPVNFSWINHIVFKVKNRIAHARVTQMHRSIRNENGKTHFQLNAVGVFFFLLAVPNKNTSWHIETNEFSWINTKRLKNEKENENEMKLNENSEKKEFCLHLENGLALTGTRSSHSVIIIGTLKCKRLDYQPIPELFFIRVQMNFALDFTNFVRNREPESEWPTNELK